MARMPRVVVPHYPHHVTQRGNRRQKTFFLDEDYQAYLGLLTELKAKAGVEVWAYCLMPNHVHLVLVPDQPDSLARLFRVIHREYTRRINFRENWRGHLWQERFHSFVMDEAHLIAAVRYVEMNPVRASLCSHPEQWRWSSVHAHLKGQDDGLVSVEPMAAIINDWPRYLAAPERPRQHDNIRRHTRTGRPVGNDSFIDHLEMITGRNLRPKKSGPRPI